MKKNTLSLSIIGFAMMTLLTGFSGFIKQAHAGGAQNQPIAMILVYPDGSYELADTGGTAAPTCRIKPGQGTNKHCKGFKTDTPGNRDKVGIEQIITIPLLRTKGSTCVISYSGGTAQQICW